jgi:putative ABC transport system permease protein
MTRLLFVKLLRDLRGTWARIVLMILALSITVVVFSAVLYIWGISSREMPRDYLSTNPASATMLLKGDLDGDQMAAIAAQARKQPGIIDATWRTQFTVLVQAQDGGWSPYPLQIFVAAPDDPMRMEAFTVRQGSWPPAAGEILLDDGTPELLKKEVGDTIVVQAPNGQSASLRISGAVHNAGITPAFQEQTGHAFLSAASLPGLGMPVALNALKIQIADQPGLTTPSRDRDVIVARARDLAGWLGQTYGLAVDEIQVPAPYTHPHQGQMDSMVMGLFAFGVAGLLLSAILVATMLNGLFTQQIPQIGIMKAIGARSGRVLQLYLLMTLLIAATSTALAILPGISMSRALAPELLSLLGIEAESLTAPWWMYGVVVAAGIGIPLLFALIPLLKTGRTTVRQALDERGVDRQGGIATRFDAGLGRLPGLDRTTVLAFRNIFRRRARFLLSVGLLAFAGAVFIAGVSTMASLQAFLDREKELRRWDVEVQLADIDQLPAVAATDLLADIPNLARVEGWSIIQTSVIPPGQQLSITRTYPDQGHGSISVTVVPPDSTLVDPPPILEGRGLRPDEAGAVVIGKAGLPEELAGVRSGDSIQLEIGESLTSWRVVGIAEPVNGRGGIFITQKGFEAASGVRGPSLLRIVTDSHDEQTRTTVAQAAERILTDAGFVVRSAASVSRVQAVSVGHMLPIILLFLALSIAISVVGFAGLTSTMSTNVLERTREFGVMRAIGARASKVRRLVVLEGIFTAAVSCVVAVIPAPLLSAALIGNLSLPVGTPFQISALGVVVWIVSVVLGAALATLAPASQASRLTVREALAYL